MLHCPFPKEKLIKTKRMNMKNCFAVVAIALLALAVSCSVSKPGRTKEGQTICLMSYNVGAFSKYKKNSIPDVAGIIKAIGAESVALQELDSCTRRTGRDYQLQKLSRELGPRWNYDFARAMKYDGGAYGIGVVTRQKIKRQFSIALPKGRGSEPRVCDVIETKNYVFASTHLNYSPMSNMVKQVKTLTKAIVKEYGRSRKPVFIAGDFNATDDQEAIKEMLKNWTILSSSDSTFPEKQGGRRIDYIFQLDNKAKKVEVVRTAVVSDLEGIDVMKASDHLPVFVEIKP